MKIFITGVAGFLGSHLAKRMLNLGHEVYGNDTFIGSDIENLNNNINFFEIDCIDIISMQKAIKGCDIVYHTAAMAHEGLSVFSPDYITKNIYQASVSTISASIKNNVKKFVFCSSMARYGSQTFPFTEDMIPNPQDPYGIAKVAAEKTLEVLSQLHGLDYNIAVPHNIVGPFQKYDDPFRNVMSIFINRNLQGKPAIIYGNGDQRRCFSYIDDVVTCLEQMALDKNINKEIINIGPDEETISILELSKLVANSTGFNGEPKFILERPQEVKDAICSSNKARKILGYKTKTSLFDAIEKTTQFIRERGVRDFKYHIPIEIINDKTPKTWLNKLI